jgi:ankyrin repeat protein
MKIFFSKFTGFLLLIITFFGNTTCTPEEEFKSLLKAIHKDDATEIQTILSNSQNKEVLLNHMKEWNGFSAVHIAIYKNKLKALEVLLHIPDIDEDSLLSTPITGNGYAAGFNALHFAAYKGSGEAITLLLDSIIKKTNTSKINKVQDFIEKKIKQPDSYYDGFSAAQIAIYHGRKDALNALLNFPNINKSKILITTKIEEGFYKGYTTLHLAAEKNQAEIIPILLDNAKNKQLFLEKLVEGSSQQRNGSSALHLAAEYNSQDAIKTILNYSGIDTARLLIQQANEGKWKGCTPLDVSVAESHPELEKLFVEELESLKSTNIVIQDLLKNYYEIKKIRDLLALLKTKLVTLLKKVSDLSKA